MARTRRINDDPAWLDDGVRDGGGRLIANLANALLALRNDPAIVGCFARDEMARATMLVKALPSERRTPGKAHKPSKLPRPVRDEDVGLVQELIQRNGLPRIAKDTIFQAVAIVADEHRFHPLRDYLDALKWDGKRRVDEWLAYYLGAPPTIYHHEIGAMFLAAMVKRIVEPGCQCDYVLVLEGPQGAGKSRACRILGGDYYSDSLPDLRFGGKEASHHLRGKWLIEIAELSAIKGADAELLKAFITRRVEQYRPAFGRSEVFEPRQCLFIGTTNQRAYLSDPTGGRRFWPVETGRIRLDELEADRDQLLAEAVALYREGMQTWPDAEFERRHIKPLQDSRRDRDPWEESIAEYLNGKGEVRIGNVAVDALGLETGRIGTRENRRITGIMEGLGWSRSDKKVDGIVHWIGPARRSGRPELKLVS